MCCFSSCLVVFGCALGAVTPTVGNADAGGSGCRLERRGACWWFGAPQLFVEVDAATGAFTALGWRGETIAAASGTEPDFDVRTTDGWLTGGGRLPRVEEVRVGGPDELLVTVRLREWEVEFHYVLHVRDARLQRWARLWWHGAPGTREKLLGFYWRTPRMRVPAGGYYFFPARWPPSRREAGAFLSGHKESASRSPGALVVQFSADRSAVWLADELTPRSDRPSVSVTEIGDTIQAAQGWQCQGWMQPDRPQEVGDADLWLLPCDGEQALRKIHRLLRTFGHVIPGDRAPWVPGAVLYSFHPGGTIGSDFRDLGGFQPATALLPAIRDLGCDSVWVMPVEDVSVYIPRDYYRFQKGLGTPEEYRTLVATAHRLGLHLLQDLVPHGGRNDNARARAHPEWLVQTETGGTLSYWCFDFNRSSWQRYVTQVARHYLHTFGVDGFRVDAAYGSKIPNWNPHLPYARASFAQMQGGLHMLQAIRAVVRAEKPRDGAVLAEVDSSVHGCFSDAVYDFRLCYTVLHELRRREPSEFAGLLSRWLHEQQFSEAAGLVRLRHIESHDSLRSLLWYGLRPQRALMALAAWIPGVPLVYHEMEVGNRAVFRRIFAIRHALPELQTTAAEYRHLETPPGVFACLRPGDTTAAVPVVNLNPGPARGEVVFPLADALKTGTGRTLRIRDLWRDAPLKGVRVTGGTCAVPVDLPVFGFTVFALRGDGAPPPVPLPADRWTVQVPSSVTADTPPPTPSAMAVEAGDWRLWLDRKTGLPLRFDIAGRPTLDAADLYLDPATQAAAAPLGELQRTSSGVRAIRRFGSRRLIMTYLAESAGPVVRYRWEGAGDLPLYAALYWPVRNARRWYASCLEGVFEDHYEVRHLSTDGVFGHIYWRPQGSSTVWDSLLHPFGWDSRTARVGALAAKGATRVGFEFADGAARPVRVRWLDRMGARHALGLLVAWVDPMASRVVSAPATEAAFRVRPACPPGSPILAAPVRGRRPASPHTRSGLRETDASSTRLVPTTGGWNAVTPHYRMRLSRSGVLTALFARDHAGHERLIAEDGDLYSDAGFGAPRLRYGAANDVEAGSLFQRLPGGRVRLRFAGRLRGFHRFDLPSAVLEYVLVYTLDPTAPTFQFSCALRTERPPTGDTAFLGCVLSTPTATNVAFTYPSGKREEAALRNAGRRLLETKRRRPVSLPEAVRLTDSSGRLLLRFAHVHPFGPRPINNVFVDGRQFFLTWYDGPCDSKGAGEWSGFNATLSVGEGPSPTFSELRFGLAASLRTTGLLRAPGFERSAAPISLRTGKALPGIHGRRAWRHPYSGGALVTDVVHSGHVAAFVENRNGGYLLWSQTLPVERFRPGSRWRLSAWVRGRDIIPGTPAWKAGVVRLTFVCTGRTQYATSRPLTGSFDWQQVSVDAQVPADVQQVMVQAGLNGSLGRMWIDDVRLAPNPSPR